MLQLKEKLKLGSPSEQAAGILQSLEILLGKEEGLSSTNMDPAQLDAFKRTLCTSPPVMDRCSNCRYQKTSNSKYAQFGQSRECDRDLSVNNESSRADTIPGAPTLTSL